MTTIIIRKDHEGIYRGFYCMGHAGYAKKRLFGTELAGEELKLTQNEETGFIKCDFQDVLQDKSVFLMDSMVFSLQNLSRQYGEQYLQVKIEEV